MCVAILRGSLRSHLRMRVMSQWQPSLDERLRQDSHTGGISVPLGSTDVDGDLVHPSRCRPVVPARDQKGARCAPVAQGRGCPRNCRRRACDIGATGDASFREGVAGDDPRARRPATEPDHARSASGGEPRRSSRSVGVHILWSHRFRGGREFAAELFSCGLYEVICVLPFRL